MSEPTILIVPPQGITAADKRALAKIGVVVIEMDDPQQARLIRAQAELSTTDMLSAAATAILDAGKTSARTPAAFAEAICNLLIAAKPPARDQSAASGEVVQ